MLCEVAGSLGVNPKHPDKKPVDTTGLRVSENLLGSRKEVKCMSMIKFTCPTCNETFRVDAKNLTEQNRYSVVCSNCRTQLISQHLLSFAQNLNITSILFKEMLKEIEQKPIEEQWKITIEEF